LHTRPLQLPPSFPQARRELRQQGCEVILGVKIEPLGLEVVSQLGDCESVHGFIFSVTLYVLYVILSIFMTKEGVL
jgi:hypothetical protein